MSIKVFVILALAAVAVANPTPCHLLQQKGIIRGGKIPLPIALPRPKLGLGGGGAIVLGKCSIGGNFRTLFRTLIGHKHYARNNLNDILNMKVGSFNDMCYLLSRLVVSLCDTLEASFRGLGNLLSRVIFSLLRIIICFIGGGGSGNPICRNDINLLVGVKASAVGDARGLIDLYELANCEAQLNLLIHTYTRGRGIKACRGSLRVVFRIALDLVNRLQIVIARKGTLSRSDLKFCFHKITCLMGVIANSHQKGLGLEIINDWVPMCNQFIKSAGFPDVSDVISDARTDVEAGNDDRAPWAMPDIEGVADTSVTISLGGLIGNLFKGLLGVTRLAGNLVEDILGFVINSADDVFTLVLKIVLGLGGALDATIAGLGSLLVRIVAGLLKIMLCFVGRGKYGVCKPGWDRQVGVTGDVTSIDLVFRLYGLDGCQYQVERYIDTHTNGKGIDSTSGSVKIFLNSCYTLSKLVQSRKWDSTIVVTVIRHVTYVMGAVGNSNSKGVGTTVCNKFITDCDKFLIQIGYPGLGKSQEDVAKVVEDANNDDHTWCADVDTNDGQTGFIAPKPLPGPVGKPEPRPGPGPVQPKPEPRPNPGPVQSKPEPRPNPGPVQSKPEPRPNPGPVQSKPEPRPNPGPVQSKPEPRPNPGPVQSKPEPRPNPGPVQSKPEPRPNPGPVQSKPEPRPNPGPVQSKPEPRPNPGPGPVQTKPAPLGGLFKIIFGSIRGVTKLASKALNIITSITINTLNDVFNLLINLSLVLEVTLNNLVFGLGSFFSRLVACIIKIGVCVNGFPGNRNICTRDWNAMVGIKGDATTAADMVVLFKLDRAQDEFNSLVSKHTRGKGIKSTNRSTRNILENISRLVVTITNYKKISKQSITDSFVITTSICASVGNSRQRNSGKQLVEKLFPQCGIVFKKEGYTDTTVHVSVVTKDCDVSNDENIDWNGGNPAPSGGDKGSSTPSGDDKGNTAPSGGDKGSSTPSGDDKGNTAPSGGDKGSSTPSGDDKGNTAPSDGDKGSSTPSGGDKGNTAPSGGDKGDNTPSGGDKGNTAPSGGDKGDSTPSGGDKGNTAPSGGDKGDSTPSGGDKGNTAPSGGDKGDSTPSGGDKGNTAPSGGDKGDSTPSGGDKGNTAPSGGDKGDSTPSGGDKGNTAPSGGDKGDSTPSGGDKGNTAPSGGNKGDNTPSGGDKGNTAPSGGDKGDNTPSGGDKGNTAPSGGDKGDSTLSGGDKGNTAPSGGDKGDSTPSGGDKGNTAPSGGDKGDSTPSGGDNGNTAPSGGDKGDSTPSGGDSGDTAPSGGNNSNDNDCGKDIGGVIQMIPGVTKLSSSIITEIINIKITTLTDIVKLTTKLTMALGGIIDSIVEGLGSILIRLVAVIFKIGYCVNGWSSNRGAVCTKEWNAEWAVVGEATSAVDMIGLYRLNNCKSDVTNIISKHTNGKGIGSTSGFIKTILQTTLNLSNIVSSGKITKDHCSDVFVYILSIFGSITNNYKQGSATAIVQKVIPVCAPIFVKHGCSDIRTRQKTIMSDMNTAANVRFDWTTIKVGDNSKAGKLATNTKKAFRNVKHNGKAPSVTAVLNLQAPRNFEDVCLFGVQVVQGLGSVVDVYIPGLGSLIVRIFGCLINYIVAILGASRNSKSFVSQKAYYDSFDVKVSGQTLSDLITGFRITKCEAELKDIRDDYTNKQGKLTGAVLVFFDTASGLVEIVKKGSAITEADLTPCFRLVTTMLGAFANSASPGVGKTICDNMLPTCSFYLEQNGYPSLGAQQSQIYPIIEKCNNVEAPWTATTTTTVQEN